MCGYHGAWRETSMRLFQTFFNDQGQEMSRTSLAQILLHISPSPLNVNETRDVYRALKEYGEVEVFKVVRVT